MKNKIHSKLTTMYGIISFTDWPLLNQSDLARDAGLSQPTVHRYLNLLETTHLFERVPAYTVNRTTRILKSPKAFWIDSGLASYLSGIIKLMIYARLEKLEISLNRLSTIIFES